MQLFLPESLQRVVHIKMKVVSSFTYTTLMWFQTNRTFFLVWNKEKNIYFKRKLVVTCNIVNVFTITFDQLNASLLNKYKFIS